MRVLGIGLLVLALAAHAQLRPPAPSEQLPLGGPVPVETAARSRKVELATYKTTLPGVPDGEYVTVRFGTDFEHKADAEELVSLTFERGAWRPTGYFIR